MRWVIKTSTYNSNPCSMVTQEKMLPPELHPWWRSLVMEQIPWYGGSGNQIVQGQSYEEIHIRTENWTIYPSRQQEKMHGLWKIWIWLKMWHTHRDGGVLSGSNSRSPPRIPERVGLQLTLQHKSDTRNCHVLQLIINDKVEDSPLPITTLKIFYSVNNEDQSGIDLLGSVLEKLGNIIKQMILLKKNAEGKLIFLQVYQTFYSIEKKLSFPKLY